jgi:hypothetical protein
MPLSVAATVARGKAEREMKVPGDVPGERKPRAIISLH